MAFQFRSRCRAAVIHGESRNAMNNEFAISARGLSKSFGDLTAVRGLDLDLPRAQIYGFLGPNGSGKTTAIRMLCGLLKPTSGGAQVLGLSVPGSSDALKPRIGYMTQKFSLYGDLTVLENMQFIADIYALRRQQRKSRIDFLLDDYNLSEKASQLAGTMSGGQKQRLALACAVLHQPELLLLDEPTSAVDPRNRRDFWSKLFELADAGTAILVSTHYMDEAERCHRLAILDHGVKVADGTPAQLQASTGMTVLEIHAQSPREAQIALLANTAIASVTQLGIRLRVLVSDSHKDAAALVASTLHEHGIQSEITKADASLEDVFVASTLQSAEER